MKIKLLKDLPDVPAGAIFTYDEKIDQFVYAYKIRFLEQTIKFNREMVGNNPDWFEETKE